MDPRLIQSVAFHEGYREKAYLDSVGVWTIGYGTNLQELQIDEAQARVWLVQKLQEAERFAAALPEWNRLNEARRAVVVEMIYNLGPSKYTKFVNTRAAMQEGRFEAAANGMLLSLWAKQVGRRAERLATQMRTGEYWNKETT